MLIQEKSCLSRIMAKFSTNLRTHSTILRAQCRDVKRFVPGIQRYATRAVLSSIFPSQRKGERTRKEKEKVLLEHHRNDLGPLSFNGHREAAKPQTLHQWCLWWWSMPFHRPLSVSVRGRTGLFLTNILIPRLNFSDVFRHQASIQQSLEVRKVVRRLRFSWVSAMEL